MYNTYIYVYTYIYITLYAFLSENVTKYKFNNKSLKILLYFDILQIFLLS